MDQKDFCGFHPELMRIFGQIEQGQADVCKEMGEVKKQLAAVAEALKQRELANAKSETRAGILYWALNGGMIAAISAGTHIFIRKLWGD